MTDEAENVFMKFHKGLSTSSTKILKRVPDDDALALRQTLYVSHQAAAANNYIRPRRISKQTGGCALHIHSDTNIITETKQGCRRLSVIFQVSQFIRAVKEINRTG
jgi:hypothetical protein